MEGKRILLRGGPNDGESPRHSLTNEAVFSIDVQPGGDVYARVDDAIDHRGTCAVFQHDPDGSLLDVAKRRFSPDLA